MKFYPLKNIKGYSISKCGKIRNDKRKRLLTSFIDVTGYYRIGIGPSGKQKLFAVHRLLALTFIPNPLNKATVNHRNGIKIDNRLKNLEWATYAENTQHAHRLGLVKVRRGVNSDKAKLTWEQVKAIKLLKPHFSQVKLGEIFGVSRGCVQAILSGWSWLDK